MAFNEQFPRGLISPVDKLSRGYPVTKLFQNYLNQLSVPFYDLCCPEASVFSPIRAIDSENIQFFNRDTEQWEDTIYSTGGGGGADGNGIYSGSGTLSSDTIVDLDSNTLSFQQTGNDLLILNPADGVTLVSADTLSNINVGVGGVSFYSIYTFPNVDGASGEALITDGSGVLSWGTAPGAYSFDNGLTLTGSNAQLGGALTQGTLIDGGAFAFQIQGNAADAAVEISNSGSGAGLLCTTSGVGAAMGGVAVNGYAVSGASTNASGGIFTSTNSSGVYTLSTNSIGIQAQSSAGLAGDFDTTVASTNDIQPVIQVQRLSSGTPANGIGGAIDFITGNTTGFASFLSNRLSSSWTTAANASRTSLFAISGVDATVTSTLFTLAGSGQPRFNKLGVGTFTGTPTFALNVDTNGNIIEGTIGGVTADNGLTLATGNIKLGGTLLANTTIDTGASTTLSVIGSSSVGFSVNNTNTNGVGVQSFVTGSGASAFYGVATTNGLGGLFQTGGGDGILAQAGAGIGVHGTSTAGYAGKFDGGGVAANNVYPNFQICRVTSGTPANGIGSSIDFTAPTSTTTSQTNSIISKWTDVTNATRTSEFSLTGVNSATTNVLLTISGAGIFTLTQGLSNFANDAGAAGGGIPINGLYRNGSVVQIRVS